MSDKFQQTEKTRLRRLPKRGHFEREAVYKILDEALVCHVGFMVNDQPFVIPTLFGRDGDNLLLHGSAASRMIRNLSEGIDVCVTATLIDGLVLARSAFHHSVNYRSVVILGKAQLITNEKEKFEALRIFTDHVISRRWDEVRPPNKKEMKATSVLSLPIDEASAKIRTGNPVDDEEDYELDIWAGVVPLKLAAGKPFDDGRVKPGTSVPGYAAKYNRDKR